MPSLVGSEMCIRDRARPLPLWLPQLAGWTPPAPCARAPPAAVESPIGFSWFPTPTTGTQCFLACEMNLLVILQVRNKKFAHIFEGSNIPTQPRRFVFPLVTLISGVSRPPARPLSLWLPQLAGWTPPALCASAPLAAVDSPTAFGRCLTSRTAAQCFQASENLSLIHI